MTADAPRCNCWCHVVCPPGFEIKTLGCVACCMNGCSAPHVPNPDLRPEDARPGPRPFYSGGKSQALERKIIRLERSVEALKTALLRVCLREWMPEMWLGRMSDVRLIERYITRAGPTNEAMDWLISMKDRMRSRTDKKAVLEMIKTYRSERKARKTNRRCKP